MKKTLLALSLMATPFFMNSAMAQNVVAPVLYNVVNISTSGQLEVEQDYLTMTLSYTEQGSNAKTVEQNVSRIVSAAIAEAKKSERGTAVQIKNGQFSIQPRYEKEQIVNWTGRGEIILEGTDLASITDVASRLNNMVISGMNLGLSPEKSENLKQSTVKLAIEKFRTEAQQMTQMFGFKSFIIKEISVNYNQPNPVYRAQAMMAKSSMPESAPLQVEPGKTTIEANVSGSIQMTP